MKQTTGSSTTAQHDTMPLINNWTLSRHADEFFHTSLM